MNETGLPSPGLSSDQARLVLQDALDAVVGLNADNRVVEWNKQAEITFGWTREEAIGQEVSDLLIPPEFREGHRQGLRRYIKTGDSKILNRRIELEAVDKGGRRFPIELTVIPLSSDGGHYFYSFLRDITARKSAEADLKEALRSKDDFIGICSHELKTPVTSLKLQFQLAAKQIRGGDPRAYDPELTQRRITMANVQLDRMTKLIEDMLIASRLTRGPLDLRTASLDLSVLTREVLERFQDQFDTYGIAVRVETPPEPIFIKGDYFRLEQVITNLFTNAIKYGGKKPVVLRLEQNATHARLELIDQGVGIAPENLERIFLAFERAVSATNVTGLGLGLYISRQIAEAHGGRIYAESEEGQGSRFVLELPLLLA